MILKSKFVSELLGYSGFQTINKAIPFLILPILSRLFTKEAMGYYTMYQTLIGIVFSIGTLGMATSVSVNFYQLDKKQFSIYMSNSIEFVLLCIFIEITLFFSIGNIISNKIGFPYKFFLLLVLLVFPQFIINLELTLCRNLRMIKKFGVISIINTIINNSIGFILVVFFGLSWEGIFLGVFIGDCIVAIYCIISFFKDHLIVFEISIPYIKDAIKIGFPLTFHTIGGWLSNALNRIIVNAVLGTAATGSYGIGASYGMMMNFVHDSFNLAYSPYLYSKLKDNNDKTKIILVKISMIFYLVIFVLAIIISLFGYYFTGFIFGDKYSDTTKFIIPLVIASAINGLYKVHVNYLFFYKKTSIIAKITFISGLINIIIAYFSIKYFGLLGAAVSTVIIQLLVYILIVREANSIYPMNWIKELKTIFNNLRK
jgi:O-antigen/teichoic acid export membrane protein